MCAAAASISESERISYCGGPLVSIGLPVRNSVATLETAIRSVLAQCHRNIELIIYDNASTDGTEQLCRALADADDRITYHRQPNNIGLLNNFVETLRLAKGEYFRWIGDDDWLDPRCISRCLELFSRDERLILVTTQIKYAKSDGSTYVRTYEGSDLSSDDPLTRLGAITSFLVDGMPIDPLYGLMRRESVARIPRQNMLGEDEVFAVKLALAGRWGHVPETLAGRSMRTGSLSELARRLGVPSWQVYVPVALQCWKVLAGLSAANLSRAQRVCARAIVATYYLRRHAHRFAFRFRKYLLRTTS